MFMSYEQSIEWLDRFQRFGVRLGLERIKILCEKLENPQNKYNVIHVGGTNGKGSVCKFISSVLKKSGYRTGLYLSPHLQRFSERIVVDDEEIKEEEISNLVSKLKPIVDEMEKNNNNPTYFEIVTAMAFQYFYEKNVDFAIIEVGLGGRFDATNVVHPILSIITNVSLEHQNILGKKIENIAFEKAGIIKSGVPVITGAKGKALKVIKDVAKQRGSEIIVVKENSYKRVCSDLNGQEFLVKGLLKDYNIRINLLGGFQGKNVAISVNAIDSLQLNGVYISEESIKEGFGDVKFPGRVEIIQKDPLIILDGAHNVAGIKVLTETLKEDFTYNKLILIIGILSDKRISDMLKIITPLADFIIVTRSKSERACDPIILKRIIENTCSRRDVIVKENIDDAINFAKSIACKNDLICITGSLFTVGEARDYIIKNKD